MTKREKCQFVRSLVDTIYTDIIEKIPQMPDEWDGIELRQYVADAFAEKAGAMSFRRPIRPEMKRRLREYRNTVLVQNL